MTDLAVPRVSVIVPAYNCARYLRATLDSVAAQTLTDWECVIVDDGSTDSSAEIAQGYAARDARFRVASQRNAGVGVARNTGYAAGHPGADYVIFLDSDDVWEPDALEALVDALDAHPAAAGAHGLGERIGPDSEPLPDAHADFMRDRYGYDNGLTRVPLGRPSTLDCLVTKWKMFPPGLVMVRRPLIARAGLWAPRQILRGSEDWDMFSRVSRYGPFLLVNRVIIGYRKLEVGLTVENAKGHGQRRQTILRRLIVSPDSTPEQARLVREASHAWGVGLRVRQWAAFRAALRERRWRMALNDLRFLALFLVIYTVSDVDLRLHRVLRRFRSP